MSETTLLLVLTISTLLDVATLALVLFFPWERVIESETIGDREPCITVPRLFLGLLAGGAVFLFKLPILILLRINAFGLVHLAYLDLVIGGPAIGLAILYANAKLGRTRAWIAATPAVRRLALLALLGVPVGIYSSLIEPFRLQLERVPISIPSARAGTSSIRLGVLADIQTDSVGRFERKSVDRLLAEKPDLILLPGDFFDGHDDAFDRELEDMQELLRRLQAPHGVFAVLGNNDFDRERVRRMFEGSAVRLLENEVVRVQIRDRELTIGGVGAAWHDKSARQLVSQLETASGAADFRILLSHYPDVLECVVPETRVDLVVSGHTHGGQVCLPGFGPLVTLSGVSRRVAAGGYCEADGRRIYVSRGLGMERGQAPRIRFFCPPEIAILELGRESARGH